jgi:hypothetical protein
LTKLLLSNNQLFGIIPKSNPWLTFDANGNKDLINATTSNTSPKSAKGKSVTAALVIGFAVALFAVGVVIGVAISISRRYYRVNDEQSQSAEDLPPPRVLQGNLLTANAIHRSNIDFTKAMLLTHQTSRRRQSYCTLKIHYGLICFSQVNFFF